VLDERERRRRLLLVIRLREMTANDWPDVERIYAQGIEDGEATFEVATPTWETFDAARLPQMRIVAEDAQGTLLGWVAASAISSRPAYRGVVEHSVYVDRGARGRGVGRQLLDAFVTAADEAGVWMIQSSIFPENRASLKLHEAAGFRTVGRRERIARAEVGPHAGQWRDTILIERRTTADG
jgi:phosphinothricin acetyltransferase